MKRAVIAMLAVLALAACDKPKEETTTDPSQKNSTTTTNATATATTQATAVTTAAPATVTIADTDLSTPADFEESAEKAITAKTYKQELATIESDLAKDKD